jgi:zinc protease
LFSYGSESLDRLAFEAALDQIGASARAGTDFAIQVLSPDFDRGVQLLADNELHPALPQTAMNIVQEQYARVVEARQKSPGYLATRAVRMALFPRDDPALRDATPETVRSLTRDDLLQYDRTVFRPDLATIVVIGHVTPEKARATIEKYFAGWSATGPKPPTDLPVPPPNKAAAVAVPDESRVQDNVVLAQTLALNRADPDYYALELGSSVLGGGFYSTRLSIDLRKNAGLVYSVGSELQVGRTRGNYFVQYASDPQNVTKAADIVNREIASMQTTPVPDEELGRSKMMLLRQIPLSEASIAAIARGMLNRRELDLPLDEPTLAAQRYIALTPAQVQDAFRKWMRPADLVRVTQGPPPQ